MNSSPGRLSEGDSCDAYVAVGGVKQTRRHAGVIIRVKPKGYEVRLRIGDEEKILALPERRVKPVKGRRPTAPLASQTIRPSTPSPLMMAAAPALAPIARAVEKAQSPIACPAYLAWVRGMSCCRCNAPAPSDPHHEGRRGVGQKVHDTMTVPLCRSCHRQYTDTNRLPGLSAEDSKTKLQMVQRELLIMVLRSLSPEHEIEALAVAVGKLRPEQLRDALK